MILVASVKPPPPYRIWQRANMDTALNYRRRTITEIGEERQCTSCGEFWPAEASSHGITYEKSEIDGERNKALHRKCETDFPATVGNFDVRTVRPILSDIAQVGDGRVHCATPEKGRLGLVCRFTRSVP